MKFKIEVNIIQNYLQSLGSLLELRCQLFAVSTPGCIELYDPDSVAVFNPVVEVVVGQLHHARGLAVEGRGAGQGQGKGKEEVH